MLAIAGLATASYAAPADRSGDSGSAAAQTPFYLAYAPGQKFDSAVVEAVADSPSQNAAAVANVDAMLTKLASGGQVPLPGYPDATSTQKTTVLRSLRTTITAMPGASSSAAGQRPAMHVKATVTPRSASTPASAEPAASPPPPQDFPLRGHPSGGRLAWYMNFEINGAVIIGGVVEDDEHLRANMTIFPGPHTSQFQGKVYDSMHVKGTPYFTFIHFEIFPLLHGTEFEAGHSTNSPDLSRTNFNFYASNYGNVTNSHLAHSVDFWAE